MGIRSSLTMLFVATATMPCCARATAPARVPEAGESSGPYCGLYAMYTALRVEGRQIDLRNLLKSEYMGSPEGSSLEELRRAATDFGLEAVCVKNMDTKSLRACPYLAILHVRSPIDAPEYNHFVLFLGTDADGALIYDAPRPVQNVPAASLTPLWDGTAVLVSSAPIRLGPLRVAKFQGLAVWIAAGALVVFVVRVVGRRSQGERQASGAQPSFFELAGVLLIAVVGGSGYNLCAADGLLAAGEAAEATQRANLIALTPVVTAQDARTMMASGAVFIDARHRASFDLGHIPGAINVPVNASIEQRHQAMTSVPRSARLVVYCQSLSCPYAETVARRLEQDGYTHLWLFRGGWQEWNGQ